MFPGFPEAALPKNGGESSHATILEVTTVCAPPYLAERFAAFDCGVTLVASYFVCSVLVSVAATVVSEAALQLRAAPPTADRQCLAALDFPAIYIGYLTVTGEYNIHFLFKLIAITF